MLTDKLFDHKYDIDELIFAFCGNEENFIWCLNSRIGEISAIEQNNNIIDGSDNNHIHIIESLPLSFLNELTSNAEYKKLSETVQKRVDEITKNCKAIQDLINYFEEGDAGSYIIKSIKGACLDWLDMRNLIPPSMRHTGDMSMFNSLGGDGEKTKVKISIT